MTLAKVCDCGHNKNDHLTRQRNGVQWRGRCEFFGCNCEKYSYALTKHMVRGGGFKNRKLRKVTVLYMSKLKDNGTPFIDL